MTVRNENFAPMTRLPRFVLFKRFGPCGNTSRRGRVRQLPLREAEAARGSHWSWLMHLLGAGLGLASLGTSLPGCLLTDDPPYELPLPTKPYLEASTDNPATHPVEMSVDMTQYTDLQRTFKVWVRSEDSAGDDIQVGLYWDYSDEKMEAQAGDLQTVPASHWNATCAKPPCREASLVLFTDLRAKGGAGCHRLTAVASHLSNIDQRGRAYQPTYVNKSGIKYFTDDKQLGLVTWWIWLWDPKNPSDQVSLLDCPGLVRLEPSP